MKQIFGEDVRKIQLEILDAVHRFCEQNGINYALSYGTLIGAIRHKGYIPWDDDIDISMPFPDFERFLRSFGDDDFKVIDVELDKGFHYICAKVFKKGTLIKENASTEFGINIDVFPIYGMPSDGARQIKHFKKIKRLHKYFLLPKVLKFDKNRGWYKNFVLGALKVLPSPYNFYSYRKLIKKYPYQNAEFVKITSLEMKSLTVFPKKFFEDRILAEFEGKKYYIPAEYDKILREIYGDYMVPPPAQKQQTHHSYQAFLLEDPLVCKP